MPRGIHRDAEHLHDLLDKGVILDKDRVDGSVDLNDPTEVYVGIIVDVSGYGPHIGALYVDQNRYHGSPDTALQGADEILTEWMLEHYSDHLADLEKEWGDEALSILTETFDGWAFELSPHEFVRAIAGTKAEGLVDVEPVEEEELEETRSQAWRRDPRRKRFAQGDAVRIGSGSGVLTGREGVIVSPTEVRTDGRGIPTNIRGAYRPVDWSKEVAIRLDDGELVTMFKNRLVHVESRFPPLGEARRRRR
jgi:hypothetical protein